MEHDFVEINELDVKSAICDDLHKIIKSKHGVDIYTMDSEQLRYFLDRIIQKRKQNRISKVVWWGVCQVSGMALRTLIPMVYMMYKLHMI